MHETNPFDSCSGQYAKYRPDYPDALIEYLVSLTRDSFVIDAGAGTGKASAPVAARGVRVVSIEPSLSMSVEGLRSYPNLQYVCATAEELPITAAAADIIFSAQAFHWFDAPRALREFVRVLRRGGYVCLFWNTRDLSFAAPELFERLIHKWNPGHDPGYRRKDWGEQLEKSGLFETVGHRRFAHVTGMTIEEWIGLSRSISYVQSMGPEKLAHFEKELREGLAKLDSLHCPYVTELWFAKVSV